MLLAEDRYRRNVCFLPIDPIAAQERSSADFRCGALGGDVRLKAQTLGTGKTLCRASCGRRKIGPITASMRPSAPKGTPGLSRWPRLAYRRYACLRDMTCPPICCQVTWRTRCRPEHSSRVTKGLPFPSHRSSLEHLRLPQPRSPRSPQRLTLIHPRRTSP